jgi:hypothetical protein
LITPENGVLDFEGIIPADQLESEDDLHPEEIRNVDAVLFNTDWTVETLFRQIEKGNINLDPQFQRREAWGIDRKSKLIESIICSFPIPNIVLAEDRANKGRYLVIDGKQRLFSISSFLRSEFQLKGLQIQKDLNGLNFSDLSDQHTEIVNVIENQPIRTVIIRNWPNEDYLYSVFYRLNSGSLPLSSQELRKALHGGKLLDYIDDYIHESSPFRTVFGDTEDRRMRDVELVLRYVAFEQSYEDYKGDLKKFLDAEVIFYNNNWSTELAALDATLEKLDAALETAHKIFGENAFKKWNGEKYERAINRAIFDTVTRHFSDAAIDELALPHKERIIERFKSICTENLAFKESIERTTKTPAATNTRYKYWGEELANILGRTFDSVSMRII